MATSHVEQPLLDEHATGHLLVGMQYTRYALPPHLVTQKDTLPHFITDARGTVGCALARGDYKSDAFRKVSLQWCG